MWTVFTSSPWTGPWSDLATWLHRASGNRKGRWLAWIRRLEDKAALRRLGRCFRSHLGFYDAVYRRSQEGVPLYRQCCNEHWDEADNGLLSSITARLAKLDKPTTAVIAPIGIGNHVDHLITAEACKSLQKAMVYWYPEQPYAIRNPSHYVMTKFSGMLAVKFELSATDVSAWRASIRCYKSQMEMLSGESGMVCKEITDSSVSGTAELYIRSVGGSPVQAVNPCE